MLWYFKPSETFTTNISPYSRCEVHLIYAAYAMVQLLMVLKSNLLLTTKNIFLQFHITQSFLWKVEPSFYTRNRGLMFYKKDQVITYWPAFISGTLQNITDKKVKLTGRIPKMMNIRSYNESVFPISHDTFIFLQKRKFSLFIQKILPSIYTSNIISYGTSHVSSWRYHRTGLLIGYSALVMLISVINIWKVFSCFTHMIEYICTISFIV